MHVSDIRFEISKETLVCGQVYEGISVVSEHVSRNGEKGLYFVRYSSMYRNKSTARVARASELDACMQTAPAGMFARPE